MPDDDRTTYLDALDHYAPDGFRQLCPGATPVQLEDRLIALARASELWRDDKFAAIAVAILARAASRSSIASWKT